MLTGACTVLLLVWFTVGAVAPEAEDNMPLRLLRDPPIRDMETSLSIKEKKLSSQKNRSEKLKPPGITLTLKMRILLRLIRKRILICMKAS